MNTTNITDHRFNKGHTKRQAQQLKEELGITCEDMEKF